ncbi:hypothetical protein EGW08_004438 [Elysia chlorotica]|uniref:F-box domain-containing protein n=1 Tax=Elysia chlorotica TaxID=188477 RepID=A0A433U1S6_ELYCH|nr:hypothetical protein EGW08_004438 [Elysia chlorotica]
MGRKKSQGNFQGITKVPNMDNDSHMKSDGCKMSHHLSQNGNLYHNCQRRRVDHRSSTQSSDNIPSQRHVNFNDLPDDVLYTIFQYLLPSELCNLRCVSRRFLFLASKDVVWLPHAKKIDILMGYNWQCSAMEMCRVAPRWRKGCFRQAYIARQKKRQMPWLCKAENSLLLSRSSCVHFFDCHTNGRVVEDKSRCLEGGTEDLTRFVVKDNIVVSGCRDGSVCWWDSIDPENRLVSTNKVHKSETHCVDFTDSFIVSGSRDTTCKVLRFDRSGNTQGNVILKSFEAGERVWSLKISPNQEIFAAGLAGCLDDPPVVLWDIESGSCVAQLSVNHRRGAGVLDLRFESPNELLTCGYDTFIRLWDMRTHTCVRQWEEPFDSALYCIDTDGENTMVVGTARHGMVRLWDKRQDDPVQMMYCKNSHSPVYSLAMDYGHLYIALDTGLAIMDFT